MRDSVSTHGAGWQTVDEIVVPQHASEPLIPVGMKNPTGGDLIVMMNSMIAAQSGHTFLYRGWEVRTKGNPHAHAILRGYVDKFGRNMPNYHYEDLRHVQ